MAEAVRRRERWTLTFDQRLKRVVLAEARQRGVRPARILEEAVREKFNPFGHVDVAAPTSDVRTLRRQSQKMTDEEFLADIKQWEKEFFRLQRRMVGRVQKRRVLTEKDVERIVFAAR